MLSSAVAVMWRASAVLHRIAIGQNALFGLDPLDHVNPLFGDEVPKAHEGLSSGAHASADAA